ncbi:bifunctional isocitrate dehydrogenase kinase/phosphatase [Crenobacter sp. SG2305]|uniref:bifunctional isocitrate dehydrogenase kinase/phosphatase n=1 Tax=Crenobacter oryzisoli TaxID=3056844 RepID=UPI0025AA5F50|nr:bifunctional isocitrate dehydrogenase kinase/phosphatase [Crenobacter sp. SG2305]MDN0081553.1 bifunctional isocitrate dehydrogenase kinase/phosphatase [Crenobacter sp. SG2305]
MQIPEYYNPVARDIAQVLVEGFNKHYRLFRETGRYAKTLFEQQDWEGIQQTIRDRIQFYDERVSETVLRLQQEFHANLLDDEIWQQTKLYFIGLLTNHKQPECAETFFNSVFCRILHRDYFNNDFIFLRPAIATDYIDSDPPTYRSYYPRTVGLRRVLRQIIGDFDWETPFAHLARDIGCVLRAAWMHLSGEWPVIEANLQIQVLATPFYRNKAAWILGKVVNGGTSYPFALAVFHDAEGRLTLDTVLLEPWRIGILFSFSRAYFLVDMEVPSGYVQFLRSMLPTKNKGELYTMLGLQKQGKNIFYRDFIHHLKHSNDNFTIAPGIKGLVMLVFTLPSYPYVFKLIKDVFGGPKETDHATVMRKYQLVKRHDRVGRMADTLEFSNVAFPKARFTAELLAELRAQVPSLLEEDEERIVIRHLYIERRMKPLNLYLAQVNAEEKARAVRDYGDAIKELAAANIFPGDMLYKNFGVTRYGRVIFYDYDEIEYLTDCNFRHIPEAPNPEMEMSGEVWYPVARGDVFPEEFATFLLGDPEVRRVFLEHHADLLTPEFWQTKQERIRAGFIEDFFPYPQHLRFGRSRGRAC